MSQRYYAECPFCGVKNLVGLEDGYPVYVTCPHKRGYIEPVFEGSRWYITFAEEQRAFGVKDSSSITCPYCDEVNTVNEDGSIQRGCRDLLLAEKTDYGAAAIFNKNPKIIMARPEGDETNKYAAECPYCEAVSQMLFGTGEHDWEILNQCGHFFLHGTQDDDGIMFNFVGDQLIVSSDTLEVTCPYCDTVNIQGEKECPHALLYGTSGATGEGFSILFAKERKAKYASLMK